MKAKVAAMEIVERFINIIPCNDNELSEGDMYKEQLHSAKQSALICVDEMIKERKILNNDFDRERIKELLEVKEEINKIDIW
tara:strand:- start:50 stop:295 length:246 start_codon:yes stop_codon:yes gene_type:complete